MTGPEEPLLRLSFPILCDSLYNKASLVSSPSPSNAWLPSYRTSLSFLSIPLIRQSSIAMSSPGSNGPATKDGVLGQTPTTDDSTATTTSTTERLGLPRAGGNETAPVEGIDSTPSEIVVTSDQSQGSVHEASAQPTAVPTLPTSTSLGEDETTPVGGSKFDSQQPPLPDEPEPQADPAIAAGDARTRVDTNDEAASGAPPLPDEAPPEDDGWEPVWDASNQAYYFYNRYTKASQWENPRVPVASSTPASLAAGLGAHDRIPSTGSNSLVPPGTTAGPSSSSGVSSSGEPPRRLHGGYNPAIHGDYDPNADYALEAAADEEAQQRMEEEQRLAAAQATGQYVATGAFNRFTGKWQNTDLLNPEHVNDENKSRRQMSAFFDVDAAANAHDGRSLKAERAGKKLSKAEVKAFRDKRREKKEEKRRAWLRD